jgi:hypothetical protein
VGEPVSPAAAAYTSAAAKPIAPKILPIRLRVIVPPFVLPKM